MNIKGAKFQRAQSKTSDFIKNLMGPVFFETVGKTYTPGFLMIRNRMINFMVLALLVWPLLISKVLKNI